MSYDGRQEYHYVAGQLGDVDPCGEGGSLAVTEDGFKIGARGTSTVSQFQGDIDEAMLFSVRTALGRLSTLSALL